MRISDWSSDVCSSDLTLRWLIGEHRIALCIGVLVDLGEGRKAENEQQPEQCATHGRLRGVGLPKPCTAPSCRHVRSVGFERRDKLHESPPESRNEEGPPRADIQSREVVQTRLYRSYASGCPKMRHRNSTSTSSHMQA